MPRTTFNPLIAFTTRQLNQSALEYHAAPPPGKTAVKITKPTDSQLDLSLAYTPGVAEPVRRIVENPEDVYKYTNKGNVVAVISNGTAVLGLGDTGALAAIPVMEGKAVLFKRFANIDATYIVIDEKDPQKLITCIQQIAPSFGGINLEDIKAPECFIVERELKKRLNIPVFHDDQHGTAIVTAAGLLNALELQGKIIDNVKLTCVGAGAAGIATMNLLLELGLKKENICLVDSVGVIHTERTDLNEYKQAFAVETTKRSLADAMVGADVFIGVSQANVLTEEMLLSMAPNPIVFAMANPDPEIHPQVALAVRDDLIMGTGRSDLPNQINNTLGFPYIFRAALDARVTDINIPMMIAAVHAIRNLAKQPVIQAVLEAYKLEHLEYGPDYFIPKPLDPRLLETVPAAIVRAAVETGVAREYIRETLLGVEDTQQQMEAVNQQPKCTLRSG